MRALALLTLLFVSAPLRAQPWGTMMSRAGWRTVWESKLDHNGPEQPASLPSGFPAPNIIWGAWDPTNGLGSDGGTFTLTGAVTAAYSPFCPSGNFSDLSNSGAPGTANCIAAKEFDGTAYYTYSDATKGDMGTGSIAMCVIHRPRTNDATSRDVAGKRDDTDANGYAVTFKGSANGSTAYFESTGASPSKTFGVAHVGYWIIACAAGTANGGNIYGVFNGASTSTAALAGDATADTAFRVGTSSTNAGVNAYTGAIAAAYVWKTSVPTATQLKQFAQYWEGLLPKGDLTADTSTTAGNACQWMNSSASKLVCFSDDLLMLGGVIGPGLTGAGNGGGLYVGDQITNVLLQSRDPSASWTVSGTLLGATSTANSPFIDGTSFPVTLLEDNDGAAVEYMSQALDMTALTTTSSKVLFNFYVRSGSGTKGFDFSITEDAGGGCTTATTDYNAVEITESWKVLTYTYTVLDGDCTSMILSVGPVSGASPADFADVAETGDMYFIGQVFMNGVLYTANQQSFPIYVETTTASAVGGSQKLAWVNSAGVLQDAATSVAKFQITATPSYAFNNVVAGYFPYIHNGAYTAYHRCQAVAAANQPYKCRTSSLVDWLNVNAPGWAAGTSTTFLLTMNWGADAYEIFQDGVSKDTDATAMAPEAGLDSLELGYSSGTSSQGAGGWIKNFKYMRK